MNKNEITFERMPEAIATILSEVSKIRDIVEQDRKPTEKQVPIGIDEACVIVKKAKATIYALARKKLIPCCKSSGKLYFFEDQLIDWVNSGQRKTMSQINAEIEAETKTNKTKRPTRRY